jgi:hypothetical protein
MPNKTNHEDRNPRLYFADGQSSASLLRYADKAHRGSAARMVMIVDVATMGDTSEGAENTQGSNKKTRNHREGSWSRESMGTILPFWFQQLGKYKL